MQICRVRSSRSAFTAIDRSDRASQTAISSLRSGLGCLSFSKEIHPGPHQSVASFNNTSQDIKHCLGLTTYSHLTLVVKGTVETA